jgi:MFS transporter, DHA1 family, inner membrane transport protein
MASRSRAELRVVACLFLVLFIGVADNQILSPLLPAIRTQFGRSSSEMGYLFTGYSLCAGISVLIWGPLSDAFGRKKGLLYGLAIFTIGSAISFFSASFFILLAGRILTGMGASMLSLNSISYAGDFFPYESRGWAMGFIMSSYFAALILGVPFGSWVGEQLGWKMVFGALGIIALLLLILIRYMLPAVSRKTEVAGTAAGYVRQYIDFLRKRSCIGALLCSLFASGGIMGFLAFLGSWLHDSFGISTGRIGLVFLASGSAALLASPLAGSIADKIGKRLQFILSSIALALLLCILPGLRWGWMLFIIFGFISLSAAFRQGPMEAVLTEIVGSASRGTFVALKNSFSQLGIALTALASGILFDIHGYGAVCFLGAALSLLAAASIFLTFSERRL